MEIEAAKVIGAGLAVIGVIGSGIGIGNIFSSFIQAVGRNPAARGVALSINLTSIFPSNFFNILFNLDISVKPFAASILVAFKRK